MRSEVHRFSANALLAAPWKNGGGTTQQIACWPRGACADTFEWRASIATIDRAGPFSAFPGVDRTIVLLDGEGVRLLADDGSVDHALDVPLAPFAFLGDTALRCELRGSASRDFNLMVRRGPLRAEVHVLRDASTLAAAPHGLLLGVHGSWDATLTSEDRRAEHTLRCGPGDGLWWAGGPHAVAVQSATPGAALLAVRIAAV